MNQAGKDTLNIELREDQSFKDEKPAGDKPRHKTALEALQQYRKQQSEDSKAIESKQETKLATSTTTAVSAPVKEKKEEEIDQNLLVVKYPKSPFNPAVADVKTRKDCS